MSKILIIGATRGLGASLANLYNAQPNTTVYGTARNTVPKGLDERIVWVKGIDLVEADVGEKLVAGLKEVGFEGVFGVVVCFVLFLGDGEGKGFGGDEESTGRLIGSRLLQLDILLRRIGMRDQSGKKRSECIVSAPTLSYPNPLHLSLPICLRPQHKQELTPSKKHRPSLPPS